MSILRKKSKAKWVELGAAKGGEIMAGYQITFVIMR